MLSSSEFVDREFELGRHLFVKMMSFVNPNKTEADWSENTGKVGNDYTNRVFSLSCHRTNFEQFGPILNYPLSF